MSNNKNRQELYNKGKLQTTLISEHKCKNPKWGYYHLILWYIKGLYIMTKFGLFQEYKCSLT